MTNIIRLPPTTTMTAQQALESALWLRAGQPDSFFREKVQCKVEHYTIPLYTSPKKEMTHENYPE